jgi:3',5'-nucleoside bisphosphate phosphatase
MLTIPADAPIDLQLHTIHSDGQWRPDDLADYLAEHQFRVAAVTDHDTVAHIEEMQSLGEERGVHIIAATEITTSWRGHPAHLLCYAQRFAGKALEELARTIQAGQLANTLAVHAELLRRGYAFPREADTLAKQGGQPARPIDNARRLLEHGHAPDMRDALARIREAGYVQVTAPIAEAVAAAHASGAVAVLAHPGRSGGEIHRYDPDLIETLLAETPLDGIEVYYPLHTAEQVASYEALAHKHHLLVSAGSDSHGPRQRYPIAYEARQCVALLARCGVAVEVDGRDTGATA